MRLTSEGTMTAVARTSTIPAWLTTYIDAWNSHDPGKLLGCMTDDAVVDDRVLGERWQGREAIAAMLLDMDEHMSSDFRMDTGELVVATDDTWAAEWTMSGTNDRADEARGFPRTGRTFAVHGLSIGRLRNGKVAEDRIYWNLAEYLTQVGLMPEGPASAG
jgi:steroid delta-isomerase-like uncharacterized protein